MLGRDLIQELQEHYDVYGCMLEDDRRPKFFQCDITNRTSTIKAIERVNPNVVIHAAAFTNVDQSEHDRALAMKVNFQGTKNVVDGCRHVKGILVYISTDFVFGGNRKEPYIEKVIPHPINVYGASKLLGEFYAREQSQQYLIFRPAWLFGQYRNNFMSKILSSAKQEQELHVVQDQVGSPTYARHLAQAIHAALRKVCDENLNEALNTIYHTVNRGAVTRYEVARELLKQAHLEHVKITPINSNELTGSGGFAKRPVYSVLDASRFERTFDFQFPTWKEAIREYLTDIDPRQNDVSNA